MMILELCLKTIYLVTLIVSAYSVSIFIRAHKTHSTEYLATVGIFAVSGLGIFLEPWGYHLPAVIMIGWWGWGFVGHVKHFLVWRFRANVHRSRAEHPDKLIG